MPLEATMSRQWASYSLRDGDKPPTPETEIRFGYDPTRPALPAAVIFPEGQKVLTQDQLAEIGVLFLAIRPFRGATNSAWTSRWHR
jgi:hypothetical protein